MAARGLRDRTLLDALEALSPQSYDGKVWRVCAEGRDPLECSMPGGRWDDGSFEVLYTCVAPEGAVAEIRFHLARGLPVVPSKLRYRLYEIETGLDPLLIFPDRAALASVGLRTERYGQLSYTEREQEYPRSQEIGEAAFFLGYQGILVPNARWACLNLVVFCQRLQPSDWRLAADHGPVDWNAWPEQPS